MDNIEEKSSVREEQFGEEKNSPENTVKKEEPSDQIVDTQIREDTDNEFADPGETVEAEPLKAEEDSDKAEEKEVEEIFVKSVDYSTFGKEQLVNRLTLLIEERPVSEIRNDIDRIKISFYKKHRSELEQKKNQFLKDGGEINDFMPGDDPLELKFKGLLLKFKKEKAEYKIGRASCRERV